MHCRDPGHLVLLSFGFIFTRYPYLSTEMLSAIYLWRLVLFCLFFVDISRQIFLKIHKSQVSPILTRSGDKVKIQKSDKNIGLLFLKIFNLKCSYSYVYCILCTYIFYFHYSFEPVNIFQFSNFKLSTRENYVDLFEPDVWQDSLELSLRDIPLTFKQQIN